MTSSKLLFVLCETLGGGNTFVTFNDASVEDENGTITAFMYDICYHLTAGHPCVGAYYLLSEEALHDILPDLVYTNTVKSDRTSLFGYKIDDFEGFQL